MTILTVPAVLVSSIAILYLLYIFAVLSQKLGAVTKMKPHYRWLYVSFTLVGVTLASEWVVLTLRTTPQIAPPWLLSEWFYFLSHAVPLITAAVLALAVVLRYWGWLFREHER